MSVRFGFSISLILLITNCVTLFHYSARLSCPVDWHGSSTCPWRTLLCDLLVNSWTGEFHSQILLHEKLFFLNSILCFLIPSTVALQTRRKLLSLVGGDDANALAVLGANFSAGFVAGTLAAGATCPLDVAKTRRQIEVCFLCLKSLQISLFLSFKPEGGKKKGGGRYSWFCFLHMYYFLEIGW